MMRITTCISLFLSIGSHILALQHKLTAMRHNVVVDSASFEENIVYAWFNEFRTDKQSLN